MMLLDKVVSSKEVREILKLLNHDSSVEDQDLLSTIASLKNAVENIVNDCAQDEDENDVESNENCILDVDGLIDETLILEVQFVLCNVEKYPHLPK